MKYLVEPGDVSICIGVDSKHYQNLNILVKINIVLVIFIIYKNILY